MTERIIKGADGRKYITTEPLLNQGSDYERGFIDGMQKQAQSSVDKAVNAMVQPAPVPLTDEAVMYIVDVERAKVAFDIPKVGYKVARAIEAAHGITGKKP